MYEICWKVLEMLCWWTCALRKLTLKNRVFSIFVKKRYSLTVFRSSNFFNYDLIGLNCKSVRFHWLYLVFISSSLNYHRHTTGSRHPHLCASKICNLQEFQIVRRSIKGSNKCNYYCYRKKRYMSDIISLLQQPFDHSKVVVGELACNSKTIRILP